MCLALVVVLLVAVPARACGPFLPDSIVERDDIILAAPKATFAKELARIEPSMPVGFKAVPPTRKGQWPRESTSENYAVQTALADDADLRQALTDRRVPEDDAAAILANYRAARMAIAEYITAFATWNVWRTWTWDKEKSSAPKPRFQPPDVPAGLPDEFAEYLRGAILYHQGSPADARVSWQKVLQLDPSQRHWRSTWAAFMLGKSLVDDDPAKAVEWLRLTRKLAKDGFADSLGLASSSIGWEARALLHMKPPRFVEAIELYVEQMSGGEPTASASLQRAVAKVLVAKDDDLTPLARNVTTRRVITAYFISRGGPWQPNPDAKARGKWLAAVEAAKVAVAEDAERFALVAYQLGEMDVAKRWLAVAPPDSVMTHWLHAKLLLRDGKLAEASEELALAAPKLPLPASLSTWPRFRDIGLGDMAGVPPEARIRGELGSLRLARGKYTEALDALLSAGDWLDSAYIAERVLTADELKTYVDALPPAALKTGNVPEECRGQLRHLLARRLARLGRFEEARAYFSPELQPGLDEYVRGLRDGNNARLAKEKQAEALWSAARVARSHGMELLGTELEPDSYIYGGSYEESRPDPAMAVGNKLVPSSPDERARVAASRIEPDKRFHYRYVAADLAWRAAAMMPDESDETANVLCVAGTWLKDRDPKAADRFYKALVTRCGKTALGKKAKTLHWFPVIAPTPRPE